MADVHIAVPLQNPDVLHWVLFQLYPYVAIVVCVLGCLLRLDREPYTVRSKSSQFLGYDRTFLIGINLFHVGILSILAGHFVGLLTPHWLYSAVGLTAAVKQLIAMVAGGFFGILCLVGLVILLLRRTTHPAVRRTSSFADIALLVMLLIQLLLGLGTIPVSAQHPDGSSMLALANWAQSIAFLQPGAAHYVQPEALIFKVHIVLGLTLIMLTPFTRLIHVVTMPVGYVFRRWQIVRGGRR
ncbi:respiratory nitrate reductase subunit gamma [Hyphomicrobium zavarzinii]|uniref:respiratory nitrate reductase subunit gamma n=1 Tax=Hyphomicrobium zavarzinii TaxID=48292 RepID=UPI000375D81F|nr:respiratory nitrate reductase subunit gamma [Hyphomicrobium zavarzinii]